MVGPALAICDSGTVLGLPLPRTLPFTTALAMPQFIGYTYMPAGITLITVLCPIACQSITAGQAAVLVDNERTARLLIMSAATVTTKNIN